jgi:hypothetical protein
MAYARFMTTEGARYPCPCCGFLTLSSVPPGSYEVCEVCYWEDDQVQFRDPEYQGGANAQSLREAKESFQRIGAIDEGSLGFVRKPRPEEYPSR